MRMFESLSTVGIGVLKYAVKMTYGQDNKVEKQKNTTRRHCCRIAKWRCALTVTLFL